MDILRPFDALLDEEEYRQSDTSQWLYLNNNTHMTAVSPHELFNV